MSLLELKLTILEDVLKRNEDRWKTEYIRANWPFPESLQTKASISVVHTVGKNLKRRKSI